VSCHADLMIDYCSTLEVFYKNALYKSTFDIIAVNERACAAGCGRVQAVFGVTEERRVCDELCSDMTALSSAGSCHGH